LKPRRPLRASSSHSTISKAPQLPIELSKGSFWTYGPQRAHERAGAVRVRLNLIWRGSSRQASCRVRTRLSTGDGRLQLEAGAYNPIARFRSFDHSSITVANLTGHKRLAGYTSG
jgi:hypothetical protein